MEIIYVAILFLLILIIVAREKLVFIISTIFGKKFTILYINPLILFSSNYSKKPDIILSANKYMLVVKIVSSKI